MHGASPGFDPTRPRAALPGSHSISAKNLRGAAATRPGVLLVMHGASPAREFVT